MTVLIALFIVLFVLLAVGGYTFFHACGSWKKIDYSDETQLDPSTTPEYRATVLTSIRWLNEQGAVDVWTNSEDGLKLHAQWLPAENPRGTILLVHGYHSSAWWDFGSVLKFYHDLGMNLLLPEQRCHGQSEGTYVTFGVKESQDMLCWVRFHNEQLSECKVILSGLSMGASTVMYMADQDLPENVVGIIADCGFTSPGDIIGKVFRDVTHLPPKPWIWFAEIYARLLAHFSLWEKDSRKTLAKNHLPILMAHGLADDFVPCEMSKEAFAACAGDKELILAEGAGHGWSFLVERERYTAAVHRLLDKPLGGMK